LNAFNLFRLCQKDEILFDIVAETGNIVTKNGNNVEATFDIVERIVKLVAFDNVASTLLLYIDGALDVLLHFLANFNKKLSCRRQTRATLCIS